MHRISTSGATIGGLFKESPAPATKVGAAWLNDLQENVIGVIDAAGIALVPGDYGQLLAAIRALGARPGTMTFGGWATAPTGTLVCDGSEVLIADYPALYAAIGDNHGVASDPDYFVLPDMEGIFPRPFDATGAVNPGQDLFELLGSQNKAHGHDTHWATSGSSGNDSIVNGQIMTDGNSPPGTQVNWMIEQEGGTEARPIARALLLVIQT